MSDSDKTASPDSDAKTEAAKTQAPMTEAQLKAMESVDTTKRTGVQITDRAAREVKRIIIEEKMVENTWLRLGVKGGGCSGFTYILDFDQTGPNEFDLTFEQHEVSIVIDKKSEFFIGGTVIDFNDEHLLNRGFTFQNPSATGGCGCGTSFSV